MRRRLKSAGLWLLVLALAAGSMALPWMVCRGYDRELFAQPRTRPATDLALSAAARENGFVSQLYERQRLLGGWSEGWEALEGEAAGAAAENARETLLELMALENLPDAETHVFTCTGATQVMDHVVHDYNMDQHGDITLDKAFRVSCNNAFAQAALMMGDTALRRTAEAFGFNDNFLFRDLVVENSVYPTQNRNSVEIAWSGAGQSQVVATPMHMCMVAAAIANDGVMMEPRLLSLVESTTGKVRLRYSQKVYRTACSPEMAQIIDGYMKDVVKSGTGTRAQVSGLTIAGKTGSAEGSDNGMDVTHAWFVGYIDSDQYPYAISVLVENGGSGGSVAAPVARQVFEYLRDNLPS